MRKIAVACGLALTLLAAGPATAEFHALGEATVMYDAPSVRAKKLFAASRGLPVEVIILDGQWVKVRDSSGELTWVERKALAETRTVIVTAPVADVRQKPEDTAPLAFQAQQGVVLDLTETGTGWARVRHRDGATGYVRVNQVWGL